MIARVWHGWTTVDNADRYETLLREEIFVGIQRREPCSRGSTSVRSTTRSGWSDRPPVDAARPAGAAPPRVEPGRVAACGQSLETRPRSPIRLAACCCVSSTTHVR